MDGTREQCCDHLLPPRDRNVWQSDHRQNTSLQRTAYVPKKQDRRCYTHQDQQLDPEKGQGQGLKPFLWQINRFCQRKGLLSPTLVSKILLKNFLWNKSSCQL